MKNSKNKNYSTRVLFPAFLSEVSEATLKTTNRIYLSQLPVPSAFTGSISQQNLGYMPSMCAELRSCAMAVVTCPWAGFLNPHRLMEAS
jgi:hypothetical protein